ncbi:MAG: hypothetical protein IKH05_07930 [Bacteroidaceae bacterium]|nr:hypothetical protein [Bacteroidaceae bacterium]
MRKFKLLLSVMLSAMAWTGTTAQTVVTDVSQLSNTKVYTIECPRGTFVLNNDQNAIVSSHKSSGAAVNDAAATDDPSTKFCIIQSDGLYYIYSPKLKKFAGLIGQALSFNAKRHVGFEITNDGTDGLEGSVFRLKQPKLNYFANNNNSGNIVVNSYSTSEGGNTVTIKEAGASTVDEQEILASLCTEYLDDHKVYKINNVRVTTWTADANGTAITGTKAYPGASEANQQFAFIKRDGNLYMYNLGAKKFVGLDGNNVILTADKSKFTPVEYIELNNDTYGYMFMLPEKKWYFNGQGGGGFVINTWSTEDDGNRNQLVEVNQVNVYDEMLDFFEAPYWDVTYNVYMNGEKIHSTVVNSKRNVAAELPAADQRPYLTYTYDTSVIETGVTEVNVTATWTGPFEISTDFANAHWYDMAMRSKWYVTSAAKDAKDGDAYITQNANTMGLVEDSYQWAFIGNPYAGFQIINKAEGQGKSFGWTDAQATNAGIPTIMDDAEGKHAWNIVPSTNTTVPAGSFCLNVPGTNLYINQFGGAGGKVKFWDSANNLGDAGSAFTIFDVPTNFASFVAEEIAPYIESTGYFTLNDAAKATIGYDEAYKTECPFETYKALKQKLTEAQASTANYILPETGYYILKNKNYGTYLGIDPSDANMYGNYKVCNLPKQIVKLTKTGADTYSVSLMGKYAPATVAQSVAVTASTEAGTYIVIPQNGTAAFCANSNEVYSCLHCAGNGEIVGWEAAAAASQWEVLDPGAIEYTIGESGYATAYFPFAVTLPEPTEITVPKAKGIFKFDDAGNITAGLGTSTLSVYGEGVTAAAGPDAENGAVSVPVGGGFLLDTKLDAVSSAYTFMFDVSFPDVSGYNCLFQNDVNFKDTPKKDGSFFIKDGKVGFNSAGLGYKGTINANTWYRIIVVMNDSRCTVYVDGTKVGGPTTAQDVNAWAMRDTKQFLLFVDNDGEEKQVNASEVCFWDVALTDAEAAMLGTVGSDPVVETKAVTAYTGKINKTWFTTTEIKDGIIPEATPVILKGDPYTYKFKVGVSEPNDEEEIPENALKVYDKTVDGGKALAKRQIIPEPIEENDLKGTFEPISAIDKYVLAKPEGKDVCFYRAESGTIAAGKAYLELDGNTGPLVKIFFGDVDDETAIDNVNANGNANQGAIYNIAGQKLSKFQKGINIVNGKKILF